ncbi:MAG: hypothetical protein ACLUGU_13350 [Alistipes shahii]
MKKLLFIAMFGRNCRASDLLPPFAPRKQNRRLGSHVSGVAALGLSYALAKGKHFAREEFVSMLLTSVNDIDSRFEGSKPPAGRSISKNTAAKWVRV